MPFKDGFLLASISVSVWREFAYFAPRIGLKVLFALLKLLVIQPLLCSTQTLDYVQN